MKKALLPVCFSLLAVICGRAEACSCDKIEVIDALEQSKDVVVARVTDTVQLPADGDTSGRYITERASFEVIETIKGGKKVGDKLEVRSELGPGPCGMSARNQPKWLEQFEPSSPSVPKAFPVSDVWLIFGRGEEPYELSRCFRSSPLNVLGAEDLKVVRKVLKRSARKERH